MDGSRRRRLLLVEAFSLLTTGDSGCMAFTTGPSSSFQKHPQRPSLSQERRRQEDFLSQLQQSRGERHIFFVIKQTQDDEGGEFHPAAEDDKSDITNTTTNCPDAADADDDDAIIGEETLSLSSSNNLSDEDLLLACRSYLQKKNRLGKWTEFEKRKDSRQRQQQQSKASAAGFFWDDPTELKYYRQQTHMITPGNLNSGDDSDDSMMITDVYDDFEQDDMAMDEDEDGVTVHDSTTSSSSNDEDIIRYTSAARATAADNFVPEPTSKLEEVVFDFKGRTEEDRLEVWSRHFSSFPRQPSTSQRKRSEAIQRRWDDPEWKARWYERRWGKSSSSHSSDDPNAKDAYSGNNDQSSSNDNSKSSERTKTAPAWKQRLKTSALTMEFLASEEFTSLSEEEISRAVETYMHANKKRAETRRRTQEERRTVLTNLPSPDETNDAKETSSTKVPMDALTWDRDRNALEEARRLRSERAQKAYQTRLKNIDQQQSSNKKGTVTANVSAKAKLSQQQRVPTTTMGDVDPKMALYRIEVALDQGKLPQSQDLELIAGPRKLAKRKELLRRLLLEQFGLRGKCVPVGDGDNNNKGALQFITNCTVGELVAFALQKVQGATP